MKRFILQLVAFGAFAAVMLEIMYRFVIPVGGRPFAFYDERYQIYRYDIEGPRSGIRPHGYLALDRPRWRINNFGWNSEADFIPPCSRTDSLIVIIGDSFIEGFDASVEHNVSAELNRLLPEGWTSYSLGMSGAELSQDVQMAAYAKDMLDPAIVVVNLVRGDVVASVWREGDQNHMWTVEVAGDTVRDVPPIPLKANQIARVLGRSRFIRATYITLGRAMRAEGRAWNAGDLENDGSVLDPLIPLKALPAARFLLGRLRNIYPSTPIVIMLNETFNGESFADLFEEFGMMQIDLLEPLRAYSENRGESTRRNGPGSHWNNNGHKVVADALHGHLQSHGALRPSNTIDGQGQSIDSPPRP